MLDLIEGYSEAVGESDNCLSFVLTNYLVVFLAFVSPDSEELITQVFVLHSNP